MNPEEINIARIEHVIMTSVIPRCAYQFQHCALTASIREAMLEVCRGILLSSVEKGYVSLQGVTIHLDDDPAHHGNLNFSVSSR
jgi:hypothetical protein